MKQLILILFTVCAMSVQAQKTVTVMEKQKPYTILVLMNATPQWLALSREQRAAFFEKSIIPAFRKVSQTVKVRLFDSEYFHARVSDFMIVETDKLDDFQQLIERLRDSKIYSAPYFEIRDLIVGQQNRFEDFNEQFKQEKQ